MENELFREFLGQFRDAHPEYADQFRTVRDSLELLDVVKQLASKGIFPTADGWYRDCEEHLDGDFELFRELFDEVNEPRNGGSKQSKLRDSLGRFGSNKTYLPDAPPKPELRGGRGTKQLDDSVAEQVFDEDREDLKAFVHNVYFEYLEFALGRNYLNFGFLQLLAFVLLCEDHDLRDRVAEEFEAHRDPNEFKDVSLVIDDSKQDRPTLVVHVDSNDASSLAVQIEKFLRRQGAHTERERHSEGDLRVLATVN